MKFHIKVDDVRFLVKALRWASQDRDSLAAAWQDIGPNAKEHALERDRCLALRKILNNHLVAGGKGIMCAYDQIESEVMEELTFSEIDERHKGEKDEGDMGS